MDLLVFLAAIALTLIGGVRIAWAIASAEFTHRRLIRDDAVCTEAERSES